jgi:hypothetical protein
MTSTGFQDALPGWFVRGRPAQAVIRRRATGACRRLDFPPHAVYNSAMGMDPRLVGTAHVMPWQTAR